MRRDSARELPASKKRELIGQLLADGHSQAEVGRRLGITKAIVSYHARKLGLPARDECARRYDWGEIQRAYDTGLSVRECAKRFGFAICSWQKAVERGAIRPRARKIPIDRLLVVGRRGTNRSHLRERLIDEGMKQDRCEVCGLDEWLGKPLGLELHHVNGNGMDNRLENLQLLCGNCHSQTGNWGGRGRKRRDGVGSPCKPPPERV